MIVREIQHIMERWAPKSLAWERDNVGLQIGSSDQKVRNILVALDVTDTIVKEALRKKIDLIISHHPLIFHPLKAITQKERVGRLLLKLAKANISLLSFHTNLDFTRDGLSIALAERIGLTETRVLKPSQSILHKIVVFTPSSHAQAVMNAMTEAGGGVIGNYDFCSFQSQGIGTFRAGKEANPFIGKTGVVERVEETRLETIAPSWKLQQVLSAMKQAHPYEEVAYDVYRLENDVPLYGEGAIGELSPVESLDIFLQRVKSRLKTGAPRFSGNLKSKIKRVAVCGGSGSSLIPSAIAQQADAIVTADVTYHTFQDFENEIVVIDAGHFETEAPVVPRVTAYLKKQFKIHKQSVRVFTADQMINPVQYYLS